MPPKCKPTCRSLHRYSKLKIDGCTNENKRVYRRQEKRKSRKSCKKSYGSSYKHIFGTKICRKECASGYQQTTKDCTKYYSCPSGFTGKKGNKFCKRKTSNKRSHPATCEGYGVAARIDISNNCMQKCLPGEGETPVGLCVKPGELVFSISDIVDLIAGEIHGYLFVGLSLLLLLFFNTFLPSVQLTSLHDPLL